MERRREKRKEGRRGVMNVPYAQCREVKGMEKMREFVIFLAVLNGRAYQTRFKSEQPIPAALGMLYFTHFFVYITQKCNEQMDVSYGDESEELLTNKKFNFVIWVIIPHQERKKKIE